MEPTNDDYDKLFGEFVIAIDHFERKFPDARRDVTYRLTPTGFVITNSWGKIIYEKGGE